jgi:2Fe-2S ferredoxin
MPELKITRRDGTVWAIEAPVGDSAMTAIRTAGIEELLALCGGACACATCHVYVAPDWADKLPPRSQTENDLLDGLVNFSEASRLSCQIKLSPALEGLSLTIAPEE